MISYTINYEDFNGDSRVEKLRFHLSESELAKMTKADPTFTSSNLTRIAEEKDPQTMFDIIEKILVSAYGVLSEDGRVFKKNDELRSDFINSAAYAALIDELTSDETGDKMTNLIMGIFPKKVMDRVDAAKKNGQVPAEVAQLVK